MRDRGRRLCSCHAEINERSSAPPRGKKLIYGRSDKGGTGWNQFRSRFERSHNRTVSHRGYVTYPRPSYSERIHVAPRWHVDLLGQSTPVWQIYKDWATRLLEPLFASGLLANCDSYLDYDYRHSRGACPTCTSSGASRWNWDPQACST